MIVVGVAVWIGLGLLSVLWWPPIHSSWTGWRRVALVAVGLLLACLGGPIALWRMRGDR